LFSAAGWTFFGRLLATTSPNIKLGQVFLPLNFILQNINVGKTVYEGFNPKIIYTVSILDIYLGIAAM